MSNINGRILIVDDNEYNRDLLSRWLQRQGHTVILSKNGVEALQTIKSETVDLVLLDIMMPEMNGYEVLAELKNGNGYSRIPIIMISAVDELDSVVKCIELGAEDYLNKPFNKVLLKARIGTTLKRKRLEDQEQLYLLKIEDQNVRLEQRVREQVKEIGSAQMATINALAKLAEYRDNDTGKHLDRVREFCTVLLDYLMDNPQDSRFVSINYRDNIIAASVLHDIGKVGVPDNILLKPGKLTKEEYLIMQTHCKIGSDTLRDVYKLYPENGFIQVGIEIAQCHHEKWDGSGYPAGLSGTDIPLSARILAVADVYDALTTRRCYKEAFSHKDSMAIILKDKGKHFDPVLIDYFLEVSDKFEAIQKQLQDDA